MRLSRWYSVLRLIRFVLVVLASCPFTAPFKPVDLATPVDSRPAGAEALLQAKSTVDDPLVVVALIPELFGPWAVMSAGPLSGLSAASPARPLQIPLRI